MANFLGKKYKLESSENFDDYMKVLGVGLVTRKMGNALTPTIELTEKDGVYTFKTVSTFKTQELVFKLGEEINEETIDGRKVKTVFTLDGNKLTQVQKGEKTFTITREFSATEVKAIMPADNVVCTRIFKAVD